MLTGLLLAAQCAASPAPGADWQERALPGLHLSLRLPPDLEPRPWKALPGISRAARRRGIPAIQADSVVLVAAWEARRGSAGELTQILLFEVRPDTVPAGRPCPIEVAGAPGRAFRYALSGSGNAADEFWVEVYWPGYLLAAGGRSMAAYDQAFTVVRALTATP